MLCMCICNDVWMMFTNAMKDMSVFETVCVVCVLCVYLAGDMLGMRRVVHVYMERCVDDVYECDERHVCV